MKCVVLTSVVLISSALFGADFYAINSPGNTLTNISANSSSSISGGQSGTQYNSAGLTFDTGNGLLYGISNNGAPSNNYFFTSMSTSGTVMSTVDLSTQMGYGNTGFFGIAYDSNHSDFLGLTQTGSSLGLVTIGLNGTISNSVSLTGTLGIPFPGGSGLAFGANGNLYTIGINTNDGTPTLFLISSGSLTPEQSYGTNGFNIDGGLAFSNSSFYGISNDGGTSTFFQFGIGSSTQTQVKILDKQGDYFGGLAVAPSAATPEPGTLALLISGLGGVALKLRRKS